MDLLLHTQDEGTVKIMDFTGWTSSEGKDHKIGRKGGYNFLGCTRYNSYRLLSNEANDQWQLLCSLIGFQQHFKEKTSLFGEEESALPSRQWVHLCAAPIAKYNEFRYELLPHPTYSSNLAPCDYFLFPNLKKWFRGKRFIIREQFIAETKAYFEELVQIILFERLEKVEESYWIKCVKSKGDYIEK